MTHHHHKNNSAVHGVPDGMPGVSKITKKPADLLLYLAIGAITVTVGVSAYLGWKLNWVENRMAKTQEGVANLDEKIETILKVDKVLLKHKADKILARVEPQRIIWSKIFLDVSSLQSNSIRFSNFSVTTENKVSVGAEGKNWEQIARFIERLKKHDQVLHPFVATLAEEVSANESVDSRKKLSAKKSPEEWIGFSLVFDYLKKTEEAITEEKEPKEAVRTIKKEQVPVSRKPAASKN